MRRKMSELTLSSPDIRAFVAIVKNDRLSISALAAAMERTEKRAGIVVGRLVERGFVRVHKDGSKNIVEVSENIHAQMLRRLVSVHPEIPWENVLAYSSSSLYIAAVDNAAAPPISGWARFSATRRLSGMGLGPDARSAVVAEIKGFFTAYVKFMTGKFLNAVVPRDAAIVWQQGYMCIVRTKADTAPGSGFEETGLTAITRMNIPLMGDYSYYYYEPGGKRLTFEDVVVHAILADPDSATVVAYILLAAAKHGKVDWSRILEKGEALGIGERTQDIARLWESHARVKGKRLPAWGEVESLARMYGVVLK